MFCQKYGMPAFTEKKAIWLTIKMTKHWLFPFSPSSDLVCLPLTASSKTSKRQLSGNVCQFSPVTVLTQKAYCDTEVWLQPSLFRSLWREDGGSDAPQTTACPRPRLIGSLFSSVVCGLIMGCSQTNEAMHRFHAIAHVSKMSFCAKNEDTVWKILSRSWKLDVVDVCAVALVLILLPWSENLLTTDGDWRSGKGPLLPAVQDIAKHYDKNPSVNT